MKVDQVDAYLNKQMVLRLMMKTVLYQLSLSLLEEMFRLKGQFLIL